MRPINRIRSNEEAEIPRWRKGTPTITATQLASLLDAGCANPHYDGNERIWDPILATLNLAPCYQPAIAVVLKEGRWRDVENKRGYIATAAYRQGLKLQLREFRERDFRRVSGSRIIENEGPKGEYFESGLSKQDEFEILQHKTKFRASPRSGLAVVQELECKMRIPQWLQKKQQPGTVNWKKLAGHAALKREKTGALSKALEMRFAEGLSRDEAKKSVTSAAEKRQIGAAWKWIDRNLEACILPLFNLKSPPPKISGKATTAARRRFMPPWEAIRQACRRELISTLSSVYPSIMTEKRTCQRFDVVDWPPICLCYDSRWSPTLVDH